MVAACDVYQASAFTHAGEGWSSRGISQCTNVSFLQVYASWVSYL